MLSLIVPVYNMESLLPRCMASFLAQTNRDFELILVDDGSTDSSPKMCDDYAAAHPDYIRVMHKTNGGLCSARNAGIEIAQGEYVVFPDPDDWVEPDYVEKALLILQKTPDLTCLGHFVDYDDRSVPARPNAEEVVLTRKEAQASLMAGNGMGGFAWNKFYRTDLIRNQKLKFEDTAGTVEDLEFAYRYLKYCDQVSFAPQYRVYHYYQRAGAATNSAFSRKKLDSIHTFEMILADTREPEIARLAKEEICNWAINLTVLYQKAKSADKPAWLEIRRNLKWSLPDYLGSKRYGMGRKIQAILAWICPAFYALLK